VAVVVQLRRITRGRTEVVELPVRVMPVEPHHRIQPSQALAAVVPPEQVVVQGTTKTPVLAAAEVDRQLSPERLSLGQVVAAVAVTPVAAAAVRAVAAKGRTTQRRQVGYRGARIPVVAAEVSPSRMAAVLAARESWSFDTARITDCRPSVLA
jgi:hypothetical protein